MPAWVRSSIATRTRSVTNPNITAVETDPALLTEIAAADDQKGFLNIEVAGANISLEAFRWEGARPDLLRRIDAAGSPVVGLTAPITAGVFEIPWPTGPAGAARKLVVELQCGVGTETITFGIDDVYRTDGA